MTLEEKAARKSQMRGLIAERNKAMDNLIRTISTVRMPTKGNEQRDFHLAQNPFRKLQYVKIKR